MKNRKLTCIEFRVQTTIELSSMITCVKVFENYHSLEKCFELISTMAFGLEVRYWEVGMCSVGVSAALV